MADWKPCLPELNVWETLETIGKDRINANADAKDLEKLIVIGALDLLYFWMYQPRARTALKYLYKTLSDEEKRILAGCQTILKREREISQMFIDGVVGINFSKGLSFYLQCAPGYLKAMDRLLKKAPRHGAGLLNRDRSQPLFPLAVVRLQPCWAGQSPRRIRNNALGRRWCGRQTDDKGRALARLARHPDAAAHIRQRLAHHEKSDAGAVVFVPGGEKRLEDALPEFGFDARAGVRDENHPLR
jgi:hypothetical protein